MLEKLDTIPWSTLSAAAGDAGEVPALLRDLTSKKGAALAQTRRELAAKLSREGSPTPAAVRAVPFLVELVASKNVPGREHLLLLLVELATGGHAARLASGELPPVKGPKPAPKTIKDASPDDLRAWTDAAVREGEATYESLLGDKDAAVRAAAALLAAFTASKPKDVAAKLAPRVRKEPEATVKASGLLAIAVLERRAGSESQIDLLDFYTGDDEERWPKPPPPLVATAATLGLGLVDSGRLTATMLDRLRRQKHAKVSESELAWNHGDVPGLVALLLPRLSKLDVRARLAAIDAAAQKYPRKPGKIWDEHVTQLWMPLVDRVFAPLAGREDDDVLPEELSDDQRAILEFGLRVEGFVFSSAQHGLSLQDPFGTTATLERFLGKRPAGQLEQRISVGGKGPWPIWKWFHQVAARKVDPTAVKEAIVAAMPPDAVVSLARDATSMAYWTVGEGQYQKSARAEVLLAALDAIGGSAKADDLAGIRSVLEALRAAKWPGRDWKGGPLSPPAAASAGPRRRRFVDQKKPSKLVVLELGISSVSISTPRSTKKQTYGSESEARAAFEELSREQAAAGMVMDFEK